MKLSIVDVSTVFPGETRHDALISSIELAQYAEKLNYNRYWVAEHHAAFIAGRAPEVLIAAIAAKTSTIRVGSGSVLLNHYSAFKVASVFCTLNELYPGRIDLGAGRATTGPVTDIALQQDRTKHFHSDSNQQIVELVSWLENNFQEDHPFSQVPVFTIDSKPELLLLGSSPWSASAAASLGLPYVFAGFINQAGAAQIIHSYRKNFKASAGVTGISKPDASLAIHVVCADTEEEAGRQIAPVTQMYKNLSTGKLNVPNLSPDDAIKELGGIPKVETYIPGSMLPPKFIGGDPASVYDQLENIAKDFSVDELFIQDLITEKKARFRSYELLSKLI